MKGLVLCGGKSTRMGQDKSELIYRQWPIRMEIYQMLSLFCEEVYFSCNAAQYARWTDPSHCIPDAANRMDHGPLTGVLSAMDQDPNADWLICGCDYPMINQTIFKTLIEEATQEAPAILFRHPETKMVEPLVGLYKKEIYPILLDALEQGQDSLRKILIQSGALLLNTEHPECFISVDTPEIYDHIKRKLNP